MKNEKYFGRKLPENIGKRKELWKTSKSLGFQKKVSIATIIVIKDDKVVKSDAKPISKVFQTFFANIVETVLQKLPPHLNKYLLIQ